MHPPARTIPLKLNTTQFPHFCTHILHLAKVKHGHRHHSTAATGGRLGSLKARKETCFVSVVGILYPFTPVWRPEQLQATTIGDDRAAVVQPATAAAMVPRSAGSMGRAQLWCLLLLLTGQHVAASTAATTAAAATAAPYRQQLHHTQTTSHELRPAHPVGGLLGVMRRFLKERDWGDSGDPSGLGGLIAARSFSGNRPRPASRTAATPEAAETVANSVFTGMYRPFGGADRRTYATAEAQTTDDWHAKETIRPRARSAQDIPGFPRAPNLGSGEEQMAVLSVGGAVLAETYQGAEAVATSDSVSMNKGNKGPGKTTMAASMLNSRPPVFRATDKNRPTRSFGASSSEGVGSLAMSGMANGKITLAQAGSAVAMSQTQTSKADQWQDPDAGRRRRRRRLFL